MDNLIAAGKSRPFIIVMANGDVPARRPVAAAPAARAGWLGRPAGPAAGGPAAPEGRRTRRLQFQRRFEQFSSTS